MAFTTPGTAVAGDVLTASFWNTNVRDNLTELAPFFTAWTSWTPATSGWAATFTMTEAKYLKVGRCVSFYALMTFSATGAGSGLTVTLPITASSANASANMNALILDTGTQYFAAQVLDSSTTAIRIAPVAADQTYAYMGSLSNSVPMSWVAGDKIWFGGTYEAAS